VFVYDGILKQQHRLVAAFALYVAAASRGACWLSTLLPQMKSLFQHVQCCISHRRFMVLPCLQLDSGNKQNSLLVEQTATTGNPPPPSTHCCMICRLASTSVLLL
jgi:hypothetical protein